MTWVIMLTLYYVLPDGNQGNTTAFYGEKYSSQQACEAVMDEKVEELLRDLHSGKIKLPEEVAKANEGTYQAKCTLLSGRDI